MTPTLSKSGVTTVTLSRGSIFPSAEPYIPNQFVGVSDSNVVRTAVLGDARQILEVPFAQLTSADITNLRNFFQNSLINWGENSFTYTDEDSNSFTVKYIQPMFKPERDSSGNFSITLVFTVL